MSFKRVLFVSLILIVMVTVFIYFFPFDRPNFSVKNFETNNFSSFHGISMQFYENMRYPDSKISYRISNCSLIKKNAMADAFNIISNRTILEFYEVFSNEEIFITCEENIRIEEDLFIAGEGGPTKVVGNGRFNIILSGEILLLKDSKCKNPNIGIHELFHALGFNHSTNPGNVMYYLSNCDQTIGDDQIELLNALYSVPSYPDILFKNASATASGRFLSVNMTIINSGLRSSGDAKINIYTDDEIAKEIDFNSLDVGYERTIMLSNIFVKKMNYDKIKIVIDADFDELEKNNNKIELET